MKVLGGKQCGPAADATHKDPVLQIIEMPVIKSAGPRATGCCRHRRREIITSVSSSRSFDGCKSQQDDIRTRDLEMYTGREANYNDPFCRELFLPSPSSVLNDCRKSYRWRFSNLPASCILTIDGELYFDYRWRMRCYYETAKMVGETSFQRSSWPLEKVKVNSKYANRKPICDIISDGNSYVFRICHHFKDISNPNVNDLPLNV